MNTVLRVKRKYNDLPLSSLVIACKRPRTHIFSSDSDDPDVKTVAQFAGTLLDVTEDFHKVVPKVLNFENLGICKSYKRMSDDEVEQLTKKAKWIDVDSKVEKVKVSKYENLSRGKGKAEHLCDDPAIKAENTSENASEEKWMTFVDMEDTWSANFLNRHEQKERDKVENYVYDLYYVEMDEDVWFDSSKIFIQDPKYRENQALDIEDMEYSSDSNSESNWRNDYPDTDSSFKSDTSGDFRKEYTNTCSDEEESSTSQSSLLTSLSSSSFAASSSSLCESFNTSDKEDKL